MPLECLWGASGVPLGCLWSAPKVHRHSAAQAPSLPRSLLPLTAGAASCGATNRLLSAMPAQAHGEGDDIYCNMYTGSHAATSFRPCVCAVCVSVSASVRDG